MPAGLVYATVCKKRQKGRVVEVIRSVVFGMWCLLECWLRRSGVSNAINTSFVERNNATDRRQNGRKQRKTYGFSRDKRMHDAATYFVSYSYNFCWAVRTLRVEGREGWQAIGCGAVPGGRGSASHRRRRRRNPCRRAGA